MNAFEEPKNMVDPKQLKSFYLAEYPETTAELIVKKKKLKKNKQEKKIENKINKNTL